MSERGPQSPARRKLMERCKALGLTREERLAFSEYLLRRDLTSWTQLDEGQVLRLLDAVEGHELLCVLFAQRPPELGSGGRWSHE